MNIQRDGDFTLLTTSLGIRLKWDDGLSVFITVERQDHKGSTFGLCGIYNEKPEDDFTPFGSQPSTDNDFFGFAESWKSRDKTTKCEDKPNLVDTCTDEQRKSEANLRCILPFESESFADARKKVSYCFV